MTNFIDNATYPFYIYDLRKLHGYIYFQKDGLYHHSDRHNLRRYTESQVPEFVEKDLRLFLDIANDKLPIENDKILIPSLGIIHKRTPSDYFTYTLEAPVNNTKVSDYMQRLIPNEAHYQLLQTFLSSSLKSYTPQAYLIVKGDDLAVSQLFKLLEKLSPLIKGGRPALYCEANVNKTTLTEIHQTRIVLCDISNRTLRIAQPPADKTYERPIQYHGLVRQKDAIQSNNIDNKNRTIFLSSIETDETFTAGEILAWILQQNMV